MTRKRVRRKRETGRKGITPLIPPALPAKELSRSEKGKWKQTSKKTTEIAKKHQRDNIRELKKKVLLNDKQYLRILGNDKLEQETLAKKADLVEQIDIAQNNLQALESGTTLLEKEDTAEEYLAQHEKLK